MVSVPHLSWAAGLVFFCLSCAGVSRAEIQNGGGPCASMPTTSVEIKFALQKEKFAHLSEAACKDKVINVVRDAFNVMVDNNKPYAKIKKPEKYLKKMSQKVEMTSRLITFIDTPARKLRSNGWVLRKREESGKDTMELTLKFRSTDQEVAACKQVAARTSDGETKFEEDRIAGKPSSFSLQNTIQTNKETAANVRTLLYATSMFPGLTVPDVASDTVLESVNEKGVAEKAYKFKKFKVQMKTLDAAIRIKPSMSLWFTPGTSVPIAVEFSYRVKHEGANDAVRHATDVLNNRLFDALTVAFKKWDLDAKDATSKTAVAYGTSS